jgi:NADH-quinone oxidoreductase subunit A
VSGRTAGRQDGRTAGRQDGRTKGGAVDSFVAALALVGVVAGVLAGLYAASLLVTVARDPLRGDPFLSGLAPAEHAISRFHVRWYTVTMIFLAFDMEMIFMYPWTLVVSAVGTKAVVEMFLFLGILFVGVLYAWREGALRWT